MVALLKEDGHFEPRPVVRDSAKLKQLVESMDREPEAPKGLVDALRRVREEYKITSR